MSSATLHFHAELNDFVPPARRDRGFVHSFRGRVSIKDMIESLGVPHTEVAAIAVNGQSQDFSYLVRDGDQIDVYPISIAEAVAPFVPLRAPTLGTPRFVLDTLYRNDYEDSELAYIASAEERILLTRDRGLLKRGIVTHAYYLRETDPQRQVAELLRRYDLAPAIRPLHRCIRCNGQLRTVPKEQISDRLEPKTREHYQEFSICVSCGQIYWKGSHYQKIQGFVDSVVRQKPLGE